MDALLLQKYSSSDLKGVAKVYVHQCSGLTVVDVLPDIECKFVELSNWTVLGDSARTAKAGASAAQPNTGSAGVEMYYGFNGVLYAQLFTGNTSPLYQINNLQQICVKGSGLLYVAYFV